MEQRFYTFTLKATKEENKGNLPLLEHTFTRYLNAIGGIFKHYTIEDKGTSNVHLHALIQCPHIKDKGKISKMFYGWSPHSEIIRKKDEDIVPYIWFNYINKLARNISDSTRFESCFGNAFIE